jgi:hypothetical protein
MDIEGSDEEVPFLQSGTLSSSLKYSRGEADDDAVTADALRE